ncbi:MAG: FtsX-like permease family protein, partial [Calditrichaeota bacterium]
MFKNQFKIAIRNLLKNKIYTIINITGLAIGMASSILIFLFVLDELSYDRYHKNAERIYRIVEESQAYGKLISLPQMQAPMGPALVATFPEVENAVRLFPVRSTVLVRYGEKSFNEEGLLYADSTIFDIFTFPILSGDPGAALRDPNTVVITRKMAKKIFGHESPIGEQLTIGKDETYTVTNVVEDVPQNSHFTFNFLLPLVNVSKITGDPLNSWFRMSAYFTYLLLADGASARQIEEKLPDFIVRNLGEEYARRSHFFLQPLTSIHLHSHLDSELAPNSDIRYVYLFSAIAFLILLIACINFMNLATARTATREREVGMRKALGAHRGQLFRQFFGESLLMTCLGFLLAIALVELILPTFNTLVNKSLTLGSNTLSHFWLGLLTIVLFVSIVAGGYPAAYLSRFQPVNILKGGSTFGVKSSGTVKFRQILVNVQFTVSIALIIATLIIFKQLEFIQNKNLGFHKEQVVVIHLLESVEGKHNVIKNALLQHPNVLQVAMSSTVPGKKPMQAVVEVEGFSQNLFMNSIAVDYDFIKTLGIELVAGRDFSREIATDAEEAFIVNEAAVRKFGWKSPVGKKIKWINKQGKVIGVVRDFHYMSLHEKIEPLVLHIWPGFFPYLLVRVSTVNLSGTLEFLKSKLQEILPHVPITYSFLDEDFARLYTAEQRLAKIFSYFSILAIFISCLGLFGLAAYAAERRTKEIG